VVAAGRKAVLMPGDIAELKQCQAIADRAAQKSAAGATRSR
jgi:hypothetical protein